MKSLQDLLYRVPIIEVFGSTNQQVSQICQDSRLVHPKDVFVAVKGEHTDGHQHISAALNAGASVIVCEYIPADILPETTYVRVSDSARSLAVLAANFYENPAQKLKIIGVTGTNGKTTVATILHQLMLELGVGAGLVSTVCIKINEQKLPASHTTPDALQLHYYFNEMLIAGCSYCFMEVSSHALVQQRTAGIPFTGALFTNITHDHLDYHQTFQQYIGAKQLLFNGLSKGSFAITNIDDKNGLIMVQNTGARVLKYALHRPADYTAKIIEKLLHGLHLYLDGKDSWFKLTGTFNAYNLLCAYATACELGFNKDEILLGLSKVTGAPGRFQIHISPNNRIGIVDYAHTPDALQNVLETIKELNHHNGKIIVVVGCGGDRDNEKRPKMGKIASYFADLAIFTSDNPRSEPADKILQMMLTGVPYAQKSKVQLIENRKSAIETAVTLAEPNDIILVAGKGHETYQEVQRTKYPFDDFKIIQEILK